MVAVSELSFRILDQPAEMEAVEVLQRLVWIGNETEVVPAHLLIAAVRNGGLVVGAFDDAAKPFVAPVQPTETAASPPSLVGFVFGFPGLYDTPDGPRHKHVSHMLGVHPDVRDRGIGFALKRAQWQMVRRQGIDRITWTFDPLLSRNAHLNISRLGAVCNTYWRDYYGIMRDGLNAGLASDRFELDWWVNSRRVSRRLSRRPRLQLDLAHFLAAETPILNATKIDERGWPRPVEQPVEELLARLAEGGKDLSTEDAMLLVEIPPNFPALKQGDPGLAQAWRLHTRDLFEGLFRLGYLVTDFVYLPGNLARSFYVLSHGDSTF